MLLCTWQEPCQSYMLSDGCQLCFVNNPHLESMPKKWETIQPDVLTIRLILADIPLSRWPSPLEIRFTNSLLWAFLTNSFIWAADHVSLLKFCQKKQLFLQNNYVCYPDVSCRCCRCFNITACSEFLCHVSNLTNFLPTIFSMLWSIL